MKNGSNVIIQSSKQTKTFNRYQITKLTLNINICITIVIVGSANVSKILFTVINIYLKLDFQRHMSMI